jgi:CheY-like chemotaxis protein
MMRALECRRILLIDHDAQVRNATAQMLQNHKAVVVHAEDALKALVEYERQPFDAVLTEYDLPDMKGDELAATMKSFNPNQRVILLTGQIEHVLETCRVPVSADVVLSKPCSLVQLALAFRYPAPAALLPAAR